MSRGREERGRRLLLVLVEHGGAGGEAVGVVAEAHVLGRHHRYATCRLQPSQQRHGEHHLQLPQQGGQELQGRQALAEVVRRAEGHRHRRVVGGHRVRQIAGTTPTPAPRAAATTTTTTTTTAAEYGGGGGRCSA